MVYKGGVVFGFGIQIHSNPPKVWHDATHDIPLSSTVNRRWRDCPTWHCDDVTLESCDVFDELFGVIETFRTATW